MFAINSCYAFKCENLVPTSREVFYGRLYYKCHLPHYYTTHAVLLEYITLGQGGVNLLPFSLV